MEAKTGEILFIKSVKDGIPNRDPLADSDARRIFGEEDGRISLSDVSIKRDVRDYVLAKYHGNKVLDPNGRFYVYVREEHTEDGFLLGRRELAERMLKAAGKNSKDMPGALFQCAFDARVFGVVYGVKEQTFHQTGPVQFGWAHSLHPVETRYVQGTVVLPSQEASESPGGTQEGKSQGTIWTSYIVPFAVFAMPGVINATIAKATGMDDKDVDLLLEALWLGTKHRQARGRGLQQPLFLLHVEYEDPFYRIGYLEDHIKLQPDRETWLGPRAPSCVDEISLDVSGLAGLLNEERDRIARVRYWVDPALELKGDLPAEKSRLW